MIEVKTFTLVAYMMYLYSFVLGSKENVQYVFVDSSLISSGNTQESRIRNLSSRLMVSKANQCPLQVGSTTYGYYVMKYIREIVNRGSIVISDSIDTRKSYSLTELDEVRVELAEFLDSYICSRTYLSSLKQETLFFVADFLKCSYGGGGGG
ncbi:hypothetical protein IC582_005415 [Cucumis melo]